MLVSKAEIWVETWFPILCFMRLEIPLKSLKKTKLLELIFLGKVLLLFAFVSLVYTVVSFST